jgi:hypothetical protein
MRRAGRTWDHVGMSILDTHPAHTIPTGVVDPGYWLDRCEGYRVVGPEGWIGTVRHVHPGPTEDEAVLVIRTGLFRAHHVTVPASAVDHVEPWQMLVVLRHDPRHH